jgi:hypothetical protein
VLPPVTQSSSSSSARRKYPDTNRAAIPSERSAAFNRMAYSFLSCQYEQFASVARDRQDGIAHVLIESNVAIEHGGTDCGFLACGLVRCRPVSGSLCSD